MIPGGKTLETLSLDKVITPCKVFDFTNKDISIGVEDLKKKDIQEDDFILLKSKNSFEDILEGNFIYLDREGSAYLRDKKIKGVGTDSLGIERDQPDHMTHIQLLEAGIIILEGLRLKDIPEGEYTLFAAPIKIHGTEAAPVRAVLIK
jgi:arylformamidase